MSHQRSVAGTRRYRLLCPIARALDRVGDRWTLLILRDLHAGPARFGELQESLPGMASNLLTNRLRQLEDDGLIQRRDAAYGTNVYELTELGEGTAPLLFELAVLGGGFDPDGDLQPPGSLRTIAVTLRVACQRVAPKELDLRAQLLVDGAPFALTVDRGAVDVKAGTLPDAQVTMETEYEPMVAVGDGRMTLEEFAAGHMRLDAQNSRDADAFVTLLSRAMTVLNET